MNRKPTRTLIITVEVYDHTQEQTNDTAPTVADLVDAFASVQTPPVTLADFDESAPDAPEADPEPREPRGIATTARRPHGPRNCPTYAEGRAQHPTGPDRAPHADYGNGRKIHTCRACGAPHRRYVEANDACGLGQACKDAREAI